METNNELELLLQRHYPASLRLAKRILRDENEAADAVQSAFSNVLLHYDDFREESTFSTWLNRIVVNQCLMRLRQLKRAQTISVEEMASEPKQSLFPGSRLGGPHEMLVRSETAAAIKHAVRLLPESLRSAWMLYELDGLSVRDLSEALGISIAAAKSRLFRARAELRGTLTGLLGPRQEFA
jgi:RNA polymerase sigma-70 factor (ECF subfamily)